MDVVGDKYGQVVVLSQYSKRVGPRTRTFCVGLCDCGKEFEVRVECLRRGSTKSCGCLSSIKTSQRFTTHGKTGSKSYPLWAGIIQRCTNTRNQKYPIYGARGITVCKEWLKFENFYKDMGDAPEGLQIDRIDNNKGYYKENCRWVTPSENQQNTRRSKYWCINGKKFISSKIAGDYFNVSDSTIRGWCDGYLHRGSDKRSSSRKGCYSEFVYS